MGSRRVGILGVESPAVVVHRSLAHHRTDRSLHKSILSPAQAGVLLLFPRVTQKHFRHSVLRPPYQKCLCALRGGCQGRCPCRLRAAYPGKAINLSGLSVWPLARLPRLNPSDSAAAPRTPFENGILHRVVASSISFAPTQARELIHSAAPPFPVKSSISREPCCRIVTLSSPISAGRITVSSCRNLPLRSPAIQASSSVKALRHPAA